MTTDSTSPPAPPGHPCWIPAALTPCPGDTDYPAPFRAQVAGRHRAVLGDPLGLTRFGVNMTRLDPGASSALRHWHSHQNEFILVVEGELVLVTEAGETRLTAGLCAGFPAGRADGHRLVNRSGQPARYLEVGDRSDGDAIDYPDVDMVWRDGAYHHRDGTPW